MVMFSILLLTPQEPQSYKNLKIIYTNVYICLLNCRHDFYTVYTEFLGGLEIDFGLTLRVYAWTYLRRPKHLVHSSLDPPLTWFSNR